MIYAIARLLQFTGLILLPLAVMGEITRQIDLKTELVIAGLGIGVFFLGWMLQRTAKK